MIPLNRDLSRWYFGRRYNKVYFLPSGVGPADFVSNSTVPAWVTDQANGFKNPGWRQQVLMGLNAATPYTREVTRIVRDVEMKGMTRNRYNYGGNLLYRYEVDQQSTLPPFPIIHAVSEQDRVDRLARVRIRAAVREEYEHFNAQVTIGEGGQALQQLRRPYQAMNRIISEYLANAEARVRQAGRVRNWSRFTRRQKDSRITDALNDAWTETTFGTIPTLSDVRSGAEALSRWIEGSRRRSAVKGFARYAQRSNEASSLQTQGQYKYYTQGTSETTDTVVYRCGLTLQVVTDGLDLNRLRELSGFRPENFAPTIYELIPYSWLFDYFNTMGAALTANATCLDSVKWTVKSTSRQTTYERVWTPALEVIAAALGPDWLYGIATPGKSKVVRTTATRTSNMPTGDIIPTVVPQFRRLSEINPLQAANIMSVFRAKVRRVRSAIDQLRI